MAIILWASGQNVGLGYTPLTAMTTRTPAVLKIKSVKNTRYGEKGDSEWRKYFPPLEARLVESGLVHSKEPFSKTGFHSF